MSECVVRMEMPKDCWRCPCGHSDWIWGDDDKEKMVWLCGIDHDSENELHYQLETEFGSRPSYCPILAALPEKHGELIDRQAVYEKIKWWQENTHDTVTMAMLHEFYLMLFGVPAIVPADTEERSET